MAVAYVLPLAPRALIKRAERTRYTLWWVHVRTYVIPAPSHYRISYLHRCRREKERVGERSQWRCRERVVGCGGFAGAGGGEERRGSSRRRRWRRRWRSSGGLERDNRRLYVHSLGWWRKARARYLQRRHGFSAAERRSRHRCAQLWSSHFNVDYLQLAADGAHVIALTAYRAREARSTFQPKWHRIARNRRVYGNFEAY
jgi:hypothetical protein